MLLRLLLSGLLACGLNPGVATGPAVAALPVTASESPVILTAQIRRVQGDRLPGPGRPHQAQPLAAQEVVLVRGAVVPPQPGDPFLPLDQLRAPVLSRGRTDRTGVVRLVIPPGEPLPFAATVLLVVEGGYYLNSFGPSGAFSSVWIPPTTIQPILLMDDRGAVF